MRSGLLRQRGAANEDRRGSVELLRFRRHQRLDGRSPGLTWKFRARAPGRACRGDAASCRVRARRPGRRRGGGIRAAVGGLAGRPPAPRGAGALGGLLHSLRGGLSPVSALRASEGGRWQLRLPSVGATPACCVGAGAGVAYAHPAALALREYGLYSQQLHLYRLAAGPEARCLAPVPAAGAGRTAQPRRAAGGPMSEREVDAELVARVQRGDKKALICWS